MEVEPGIHVLSFWIKDEYQNPIASREVIVLPIPGGQTEEPLDIGTVVITPPDSK